ncbi:MAG: hypothetical protein K1X89_15150 [Myxococcaceae bacterium]|nr:hypothetical protein [Myxococcaceae bacterium]
MANVGGVGEKLFKQVAKEVVGDKSPGKSQVQGPEMTLAVAALSVDGFTKRDAQLLKTTFADANLSIAARAVYTDALGVDAVDTFKAGSYGRITGTVERRDIMAIGGEAPPSGDWLKLSSAIKVDGKLVDSVYLGDGFRSGSKLALNGRFDVGTYGGVETTAHTYVQLTGISNLGKGEPLFDGKKFTDAEGKTLARLSYNRPMIMDAPAVILVLSADQKKAFVGSMGGFIRPEMNPFHGFRSQKELVKPTRVETSDLTVGATTLKKNGESLDFIGKDAQNRRWYFDGDRSTAFGVMGGKVDLAIHTS